jgi:nitrile hydratase accessory protein
VAPCDGDGPVFAEPWQARAFAIVVHLCEAGRYPWEAFQRRLIAEVGAAGGGGETTPYYEHWLSACETLLVELGLASSHELGALKDHLAANRPEPTKAVANPVMVDPARTLKV